MVIFIPLPVHSFLPFRQYLNLQQELHGIRRTAVMLHGQGAPQQIYFTVSELWMRRSPTVRFWPADGYLATVMTTTSYAIPANSLTVGNRLLLLGIGKTIPVENAAPGSGFIISGFNYTPVTVSNAVLTSIEIDPYNPSLIKGTTQQLTATGSFTDETTQNLTGLAGWSSWSESFATINGNGLAYGVDVGSTRITASLGDVSGSAIIAVFPGTLNSITITPAGGCIGKGKTQQYTASGSFSDNSMRDVTNQVTWTTTDTAKVTIDPKGMATVTGIGLANIGASLWGVSASAPVKLVAGFNDPVKYPDTSEIWYGSTAVGDLNGDERNDVAVLEMLNGSRVLSYYQNSSGTLNSAVIRTTDIALQGLAIADINSDGLSELIVSGKSTTAPSGFLGRVEIFQQDPDTHILGAPQIYTLSTNTVVAMAVAELNGDGLPDLVISGQGSGTNGVLSFLFQQNGGGLGSEVTYTSVPVYGLGELHVADMDNNHLNDVVLQSGTNQFAVIKQTASGIFSTNPSYYTPHFSDFSWASSFALGDVNDDGLADLVIADPDDGGSYLNIFHQTAGGALSGPTLRTIPMVSQDEVHIADIDGDGLNDVVILTDGHTVNILYQYPDHSFSDMSGHYLPETITGGIMMHPLLSVGDLNSDGLPDIVSAWTLDGLYVLHQKQ